MATIPVAAPAAVMCRLTCHRRFTNSAKSVQAMAANIIRRSRNSMGEEPSIQPHSP